jgi:peptidoglycan hydrolase-like protein with peptidoglycan-binding domain
VRRLRTLALIVLGSFLFAALGYGAALTRAATGESDPKPPDGPVTAPVQMRRIQSSVVARGDAGFSDPVKVTIATDAPLPVITRTPVAVGDRVAAGDVLIEITGRPVLLLPGRLPAYRDLVDGDTGPDVLQLETALAALGYDPGEVDDEYTAATGAAVAALYEARGYRPPTATAPPPPDQPSAGQSSADAPAGAGSSSGAGTAAAEVTPLPMSEVAYVPTLPRRMDRLPGHVGGTLSSQPALLSGTTPIVTVGLTTADVGDLHAGMRAVVDLPRGGHVTGRLGSVHRTATGGTTTIRLPVLAPHAQASLKNANVRVTVPLRASSGKVLVVPVAALSTDAGGIVHVVRVDSDGTSHPVQVRLGLAADGFAQVRPQGGRLEAGDRVEVGE